MGKNALRKQSVCCSGVRFFSFLPQKVSKKWGSLHPSPVKKKENALLHSAPSPLAGEGRRDRKVVAGEGNRTDLTHCAIINSIVCTKLPARSVQKYTPACKFSVVKFKLIRSGNMLLPAFQCRNVLAEYVRYRKRYVGGLRQRKLQRRIRLRRVGIGGKKAAWKE